MTTNSLFIVLPRTSISKRFIFGLHVILTLALMATRAQADRLGGPGYVPEVAGHCIDTGEAADVRFDLGVVPGSAPATRSPGNHSSLIHAKIPTVPSWPVAQQAPPAAAAASSSPSPKPTAPHDTPTDVRDTTASPSEPPTECDRIAAPRPPILSSSDVHETNESDWRRGVEACQAEVKAHPEEIRFVYQLGRAQDKLKDYISALHNYKTAADAGYTDALLDLGILYYYGHGVVRNYSTAFENIKKAADAGSSKAMANVAAMYGDGLGVPKNPEKALDLAEKAIEAGAPFGLQIVAAAYFNGSGVPRDYAMAAQYYQQAADLGSGLAMKSLANMYESGYLGAPNPDKASELRRRAQQVDPESRDPVPAHLPMLRKTISAGVRNGPIFHRRRYVVYHSSYNPAWQAAPGDTRCCPNNMLVCPLGRHFCGH